MLRRFARAGGKFLRDLLATFPVYDAHFRTFLTFLITGFTFVVVCDGKYTLLLHPRELGVQVLNFYPKFRDDFIQCVSNYERILSPKLYGLQPAFLARGMNFYFRLLLASSKSLFVAKKLSLLHNRRVINCIRFAMFSVFLAMSTYALDGKLMSKFVCLVNFSKLFYFLFNKMGNMLDVVFFAILSAIMYPLHMVLDIAFLIILVHELVESFEGDTESMELVAVAMIVDCSHKILFKMYVKRFLSNEISHIVKILTTIMMIVSCYWYAPPLQWRRTWPCAFILFGFYYQLASAI